MENSPRKPVIIVNKELLHWLKGKSSAEKYYLLNEIAEQLSSMDKDDQEISESMVQLSLELCVECEVLDQKKRAQHAGGKLGNKFSMAEMRKIDTNDNIAPVHEILPHICGNYVKSNENAQKPTTKTGEKGFSSSSKTKPTEKVKSTRAEENESLVRKSSNSKHVKLKQSKDKIVEPTSTKRQHAKRVGECIKEDKKRKVQKLSEHSEKEKQMSDSNCTNLVLVNPNNVLPSPVYETCMTPVHREQNNCEIINNEPKEKNTVIDCRSSEVTSTIKQMPLKKSHCGTRSEGLGRDSKVVSDSTESARAEENESLVRKNSNVKHVKLKRSEDKIVEPTSTNKRQHAKRVGKCIKEDKKRKVRKFSERSEKEKLISDSNGINPVLVNPDYVLPSPHETCMPPVQREQNNCEIINNEPKEKNTEIDCRSIEVTSTIKQMPLKNSHCGRLVGLGRDSKVVSDSTVSSSNLIEDTQKVVEIGVTEGLVPGLEPITQNISGTTEILVPEIKCSTSSSSLGISETLPEIKGSTTKRSLKTDILAPEIKCPSKTISGPTEILVPEIECFSDSIGGPTKILVPEIKCSPGSSSLTTDILVPEVKGPSKNITDPTEILVPKIKCSTSSSSLGISETLPEIKGSTTSRSLKTDILAPEIKCPSKTISGPTEILVPEIECFSDSIGGPSKILVPEIKCSPGSSSLTTDILVPEVKGPSKKMTDTTEILVPKIKCSNDPICGPTEVLLSENKCSTRTSHTTDILVPEMKFSNDRLGGPTEILVPEIKRASSFTEVINNCLNFYVKYFGHFQVPHDLKLSLSAFSHKFDRVPVTNQDYVRVFCEIYLTYFGDNVYGELNKGGEILHLAISDLQRRNERLERSLKLSSEHLKSEEKKRADSEYCDMVSLRGKAFRQVILSLMNTIAFVDISVIAAIFCRITQALLKISSDNIKYIDDIWQLIITFLTSDDFGSTSLFHVTSETLFSYYEFSKRCLVSLYKSGYKDLVSNTVLSLSYLPPCAIDLNRLDEITAGVKSNDEQEGRKSAQQNEKHHLKKSLTESLKDLSAQQRAIYNEISTKDRGNQFLAMKQQQQTTNNSKLLSQLSLLRSAMHENEQKFASEELNRMDKLPTLQTQHTRPHAPTQHSSKVDGKRLNDDMLSNSIIVDPQNEAVRYGSMSVDTQNGGAPLSSVSVDTLNEPTRCNPMSIDRQNEAVQRSSITTVGNWNKASRYKSTSVDFSRGDAQHISENVVTRNEPNRCNLMSIDSQNEAAQRSSITVGTRNEAARYRSMSVGFPSGGALHISENVGTRNEPTRCNSMSIDRQNEAAHRSLITVGTQNKAARNRSMRVDFPNRGAQHISENVGTRNEPTRCNSMSIDRQNEAARRSLITVGTQNEAARNRSMSVDFPNGGALHISENVGTRNEPTRCNSMSFDRHNEAAQRSSITVGTQNEAARYRSMSVDFPSGGAQHISENAGTRYEPTRCNSMSIDRHNEAAQRSSITVGTQNEVARYRSMSVDFPSGGAQHISENAGTRYEPTRCNSMSIDRHNEAAQRSLITVGNRNEAARFRSMSVDFPNGGALHRSVGTRNEPTRCSSMSIDRQIEAAQPSSVTFDTRNQGACQRSMSVDAWNEAAQWRSISREFKCEAAGCNLNAIINCSCCCSSFYCSISCQEKHWYDSHHGDCTRLFLNP